MTEKKRKNNDGIWLYLMVFNVMVAICSCIAALWEKDWSEAIGWLIATWFGAYIIYVHRESWIKWMEQL